MIQAMKKRMKNEKGLTLIELLAVVVILAIIAAIAIPAIGRLIDNSKLDAHIANAQQMESAAKTAISSDKNIFAANSAADKNDGGIGSDNELTMKELIEEGYLDEPDDPDTKKPYSDADQKASKVIVEKGNKGALSYTVIIKGSERGMATPEKASKIKRSDFK